jgi:hypothetical protein
MGLDISVSSGSIQSIISSSSVFSYHPGSIVIDSMTGNINSYGSAVAPSFLPGAAGTGLGTSRIITEMAILGDQSFMGNSAADLNFDWMVDIRDLGIFSSKWLTATASPFIADFNRNGICNFIDYNTMLINGHFSPAPACLSNLLVLQLDYNAAIGTTIIIKPESINRGGVVGRDGTSYGFEPASFFVPEPASMLLLAAGAMIRFKFRRK